MNESIEICGLGNPIYDTPDAYEGMKVLVSNPQDAGWYERVFMCIGTYSYDDIVDADDVMFYTLNENDALNEENWEDYSISEEKSKGFEGWIYAKPISSE